MGIDIHDPLVYSIPIFIHTDYKPTWAEKRRGELLWKLKSIKAIRNKVYVALLLLISIPIIIAFVVWLAILAKSEMTSILLGIMGAQLIILSYYFWIDQFECDPNHVKINRKRS